MLGIKVHAHMIMELHYSDHQLLIDQSNQGPSPSTAQFGQEASSKKNPGCFKLLMIMEPPMQQYFF